ncbi:MAG: hypothetical protein RPR28_07765 [Cycloclasticus sp.]
MLDFKEELLSRIKTKAGGNSRRGMKEVASDLINNMGLKDLEIAKLAYLSVSTVARMRELTPAKSGCEYRPMSETIERIIRASGAEIALTPVEIKKSFQNKPKEDN